MSEPIIIETTTTTRERLVLVPPGTCTDYEDRPGRVRLVTTDARDATPADLERAGWVPLAAQPDPGTLAHLRADLRDMTVRAEKAERELAEVSRAASGGMTVREAARARCALGGPDAQALEGALSATERERDEALLRAHAGVVHYEILRQSGEEAARQRDEARAEVERLTAPGEGEPTDEELSAMWTPAVGQTYDERRRLVWRAGERAGVAHERARHGPCPLDLNMPIEAVDAEIRAAGGDPEAIAARGLAFVRECQQPAKNRATDEELWRIFDDAREAEHGLVSRAVVNAVAARVRQERCLVTQAVAANVDIRVAEDDRGGFMVGAHAHGRDEELERAVLSSDVPATLARLLGEVSK